MLQACDLEPTDSRGVYKNINLDMRQYKNLRMFLHAEAQEGANLDMVKWLVLLEWVMILRIIIIK